MDRINDERNRIKVVMQGALSVLCCYPNLDGLWNINSPEGAASPNFLFYFYKFFFPMGFGQIAQ
jgi:hypothetical protein